MMLVAIAFASGYTPGVEASEEGSPGRPMPRRARGPRPNPRRTRPPPCEIGTSSALPPRASYYRAMIGKLATRAPAAAGE